MLSKEELLILIADMESDRIERTVSISDKDKFCEAICAFSNDFPNHKLPGYLIIGINDKSGKVTGVHIDDALLKNLAGIRDEGNILPKPALSVHKYSLEDGDVAVVEVFPNPFPPVRFRGRLWIRNGPRKAIAGEAEERILSEKRTSSAKTFDSRPCFESTISDLNIEIFRIAYQPLAVDPEIIAENHRDIKLQLASLRLFDLSHDCPTNAGILLLGVNPLYFFPGAYVQYLRYNGNDLEPGPVDVKFSGDLVSRLHSIEDFLKYNIVKNKAVRGSGMSEDNISNYPFWALRELFMNAIMHRDYESNAPIYINEFNNRIEVINPGGLYGGVRPENFPNASDYRNPILSEALKVLGYINKYNFGVRHAQKLLFENGNSYPEFDLTLVTKFMVKIPISRRWIQE
jgi:ATP-dependent DNA helicase RecG